MNFKTIFEKIETSLKENLMDGVNVDEFNKKAGSFKEVGNLKNSDEIFWILTYVGFYSGIKAVTIEKKFEGIKSELYGLAKICKLNDEQKTKIIKNIGFKNKCDWCFDNSKSFQKLIDKFGSFSNYCKFHNVTYPPQNSANNESLDELKKDLKCHFSGLGPATVNHFLTDLGFSVLKPDRVVCRIFNRLGLIKSADNLEEAIKVGSEFQKATNFPIRYIDIIFVKYGQEGESTVLGTKDGICLKKKPKCNLCGVRSVCLFSEN